MECKMFNFNRDKFDVALKKAQEKENVLLTKFDRNFVIQYLDVKYIPYERKYKFEYSSDFISRIIILKKK